MMKKKQLLMIAAVVATAFATSCGDDEKTPPIENGNGGKSPDVQMVNVGTSLTFTDNNSLAESKAWSVSPAAGATLSAAADGESASVMFDAAGDYDVVSTRTFSSAFVNASNDTTFSVEVFDLVEVAITATQVNADGSDGAEITLANDGLTIVVAGSSVRFNNNTTGDADGSAWTFDGGTPATASDVAVGGSIDVMYDTPGEYGVSVTASRATPASESTVDYTKVIKVVTPLDLVSTTSAESGAASAIWVKFSEAIDAATLSTTGFNVAVDNVGNESTVDVASAAVNAEDASIVELTLARALKSSEIITLSYSDGTVTGAAEGAPANAIEGKFVSNHKAISFAYGDFENVRDTTGGVNFGGFSGLTLYGASYGVTSFIVGGNEYNVRAAWGPAAATDLGASTNEPFDGNVCMRLKGTLATDVSDMGVGYTGPSQKFNIVSGKTYMISVMVNVLSSGQFFQPADRCAAQTEAECLRDGSFDIFIVNYAGWGNIDQWATKDIASGWTQLTTQFTANADVAGTYPFLRQFGIGEMLIDNLVIAEVEN